MDRKQIAVFGYYGFANTGDDAVLQSMLDDFRAVYDKAIDIIVFSNDPEATEEQYKEHDIKCIKWDNFELLNFAIQKSDLLIIGGGGLYNCYLDYPSELFLKGNHSYFSVVTFGLPYLAEIHGTPCMIYGVGASDILSDKACRHIGLGLSKCSAVTVRDKISKKLLNSLPEAGSVNIQVTGDPVFRLKDPVPSDNKTEEILKEIEKLPRPVLGISLRNWEAKGNEERTVKSVSEAVNHFYHQYGGSIVLLPFDNGGVLDKLSEDNLIFKRLREQLDKGLPVKQFDGYLEPKIALKVISYCDLTLCMRLHPVVMSIRNAVPVIGLVYDQKVKNIMNMCGMDSFTIDLENINATVIIERLDNLYLNKTQISGKLNAACHIMQEKSLENVTVMQELLSDKKTTGNTGNRSFFIKKHQYQKDEISEKMLKEYFSNSIFEKVIAYEKKQFELQNFREVIRVLGLIKSNEMSGQFAYEMAFSLHQCKEYERAIQFYQSALDKGFDEFWVKYNQAFAFLNLGRHMEAEENILEAYRLNANHEGIKKLYAQYIRNEKKNKVNERYFDEFK